MPALGILASGFSRKKLQEGRKTQKLGIQREMITNLFFHLRLSGFICASISSNVDALRILITQVDKIVKMFKLDYVNRLSIEIEPEQHRQIKTLATFAGMTIKDFILAKTLGSQREVEDATERLTASPRNAARLREAIATPESEHRVFETVEDLRDALGI